MKDSLPLSSRAKLDEAEGSLLRLRRIRLRRRSDGLREGIPPLVVELLGRDDRNGRDEKNTPCQNDVGCLS